MIYIILISPFQASSEFYISNIPKTYLSTATSGSTCYTKLNTFSKKKNLSTFWVFEYLWEQFYNWETKYESKDSYLKFPYMSTLQPSIFFFFLVILCITELLKIIENIQKVHKYIARLIFQKWPNCFWILLIIFLSIVK